MSNELLQYVVPAVVGLVGGAVGSLVAPWVVWGIEKRKLRMAARRDLIAFSRNAVSKAQSRRQYQAEISYSQIRPYLSAETIAFVERRSNGQSEAHEDLNVLKQLLYEDIQALERAWGLM